MAVEELFLGSGEVVSNPGVERRGGFFDEGDGGEAGLSGGHDGEFAGFFVEGGGYGEDEVLVGEGGCGEGGVPGLADVFEEGGRDVDG